jgi:ABC-type antimicrobial peptide transport system permease subunit
MRSWLRSALALAAVGIYGVVAYNVGRSRKEIAVRIALGARNVDVFSRVVGGMLFRAAAGVCGGVVIALVASSYLEPLVFETSTRDAAVYAGVALVLMAIAFLGAAVPARRAVRVDPAGVLREE